MHTKKSRLKQLADQGLACLGTAILCALALLALLGAAASSLTKGFDPAAENLTPPAPAAEPFAELRIPEAADWTTPLFWGEDTDSRHFGAGVTLELDGDRRVAVVRGDSSLYFLWMGGEQPGMRLLITEGAAESVYIIEGAYVENTERVLAGLKADSGDWLLLCGEFPPERRGYTPNRYCVCARLESGPGLGASP